MRRTLPPDLAEQVGALDPSAIDEVIRESWPVVRDQDELHDALLTLVWLPEPIPNEWAGYLPALLESSRVVRMIPRPSPHTPDGASGYMAAENQERLERLFFYGDDTVLDTIVLGWMESTGPTTTGELADRLHLAAEPVGHAMLRLEASGQVLRGRFRSNSALSPQHSTPAPEWCHRRLLARIHRLTIGQLRKDVEPVTASDFMKFLLQWQHVASSSRLHGEAGLMEAVRQLAGFESAASAWEPQLLRLRLAKYEPELLDRLCLSGAVSWGRLSPHPRLAELAAGDRAHRIVPTSVAPISLFPREDGEWLLDAFQDETSGVPSTLVTCLSPVAQNVRHALAERGACFFADLVRTTGSLASEVEAGLWELIAAGLVTADGFDNLRALTDPHRRRAEGRERSRRPRHATGRWSLLRHAERCRLPAASLNERIARQLLHRYGVVFRDVLARESLISSWRDLLVQYRRMEMTGEIRGGRFVSGFIGEQFALPEALESLRTLRMSGGGVGQEIKISACDPLNLAGIILPGPRIPALTTNFLVLKDGVIVRVVVGRSGDREALEGATVAASRIVRRTNP